MPFKKCVFVLLCLFVVTPLFSESLSIFSEDPAAKIYVNGQHVGVHQLVNYEVPPGEYLVKVVVAQGVAYSQLVRVEKDTPKVVNTTRFVPATMNMVPDRSAKLIEGERLKLSRGNFGMGWEFGPISGLSIRYDLDSRWGLGGTGWYARHDDGLNSSFMGSVYYSLVNTMVANQAASVYLSGGLGFAQNTRSEILENDSVVSVSVGFFQKGGLLFGDLENSFWNFEIGMGAIDRQDRGNYSGVILKLGQTFFF